MSSHLYTIVGSLVCAALAIFSAYRVWRSVTLGEAVVDINYLIAMLSGRDPALTNPPSELTFSREDFPRVFWVIVVFWSGLCALMAVLLIGILRSGVH